MENQAVSVIYPTYPAYGFVRVGAEILNPRYVVNVEDRGMVDAYKPSYAKGKWIAMYSGSRVEEGVETGKVRHVIVSFSDRENTTDYYGAEAEAIWNYFSAIAFPLELEAESTLDNLT